MKKWSMLILALLILAAPTGGPAQSLPVFLSAVSEGLSDGLFEGAQRVYGMGGDLTLALEAQEGRIEEGGTLLLTLTAGNPYPQQTPVTLTIELPERLSCSMPLTWTAVLAAAQTDPLTGEIVPSETVFTREVTLTPGGASEQATLRAEMEMGQRFYRATEELKLCVPQIAAQVEMTDADHRLLRPGDTMTCSVCLVNEGTAGKEVALELTVPDGVQPAEPLPEGFAAGERTIYGAVHVQAQNECVISLPLCIAPDALDGDEDGLRLVSAGLTVDGERVAVPKLRIVGPVISARLAPQMDSLKEGGEMELAITVVNAGLAAADVDIACRLPQGLTVLDAALMPGSTMRATADEAQEEHAPTAAWQEDGLPPPDAPAQPVLAETALAREIGEDGALKFSLHMDAARETEGGAAAAAREIRLKVRADMPEQEIENRLLGASLAWRTDGGETKLGEAMTLRIVKADWMGLSRAEWNGILLAGLLMLATVCCLYSAVKTDRREEEYCFE